MTFKVGIDIGGTKIAGGVVDAHGRIIEKVRIDTPTDTATLAQAVIDMASRLRAAHPIAAIGGGNCPISRKLSVGETQLPRDDGRVVRASLKV